MTETIIEENGVTYRVITFDDGTTVKHVLVEEDEYLLEIAADKTVIVADGQDKAVCTCTLYKNGEVCSEFDGVEWFVPIIDITGVQADLIELTLQEGQATYEFSTTRPGIYTVRLDLIRPQTRAKLADNIEIIAKRR